MPAIPFCGVAEARRGAPRPSGPWSGRRLGAGGGGRGVFAGRKRQALLSLLGAPERPRRAIWKEDDDVVAACRRGASRFAAGTRLSISWSSCIVCPCPGRAETASAGRSQPGRGEWPILKGSTLPVVPRAAQPRGPWHGGNQQVRIGACLSRGRCVRPRGGGEVDNGRAPFALP